ncbi:glycine dehydrogenase [Sesbania bispinosa]|nr:glycine dehydrogenase [Sesbania bispinosa]
MAVSTINYVHVEVKWTCAATRCDAVEAAPTLKREGRKASCLTVTRAHLKKTKGQYDLKV